MHKHTPTTLPSLYLGGVMKKCLNKALTPWSIYIYGAIIYFPSNSINICLIDRFTFFSSIFSTSTSSSSYSFSSLSHQHHTCIIIFFLLFHLRISILIYFYYFSLALHRSFDVDALMFNVGLNLCENLTHFSSLLNIIINNIFLTTSFMHFHRVVSFSLTLSNVPILSRFSSSTICAESFRQV